MIKSPISTSPSQVATNYTGCLKGGNTTPPFVNQPPTHVTVPFLSGVSPQRGGTFTRALQLTKEESDGAGFRRSALPSLGVGLGPTREYGYWDWGAAPIRHILSSMSDDN